MGVITTETSPRRWISSADRDAGCCIFMEFVVYIIPKTTGVGFSKRWVPLHKTMRIFFEGAHPSFLWLSAVLFLVFRGSVLWLSDSFLFDFFFSSWFCLVFLILYVLLRQEIAFGVQRRVAYSEVLLLSLFLFLRV